MAETALTPAVLSRLGEADLIAYKTLRDAVLLAHPEAFTSDADAEAAKPPQALRARFGTPPLHDGRFTLGAWRDGALVGALSCERDARVKLQHIGHLVGMMVQPGLQGQGIGRALLRAGIAEALRSNGLEMLTLSVTASNEAAVHLYRRAGFACYGTLPAAIKIGSAYHAKDLMVLHLRHGTA